MILKVSNRRSRQLQAAGKLVKSGAMPLYDRERRALVEGGYAPASDDDARRMLAAQRKRAAKEAKRAHGRAA